MKKVPLWYPLLLAVVFTIFGAIFLPSLRLVSFAPFLAISFQRMTFSKSLWIAFGCGLIMDVFTSQLHFGLYAATYVLTAFLCYHQKRHFFEDKSIALSLFTAVLSAISSLVFIAATLFFDRQFPLSLEVLFSDVIITPILDALYAFVWFTVPMKLYLYIVSGAWKKFFKNTEDSA